MRHVPILLIHGFNGAPTNWTGPDDRFPEFLAAHGFDPDLIRVFDYGYDEHDDKHEYNALGDMREIAHRLDMADSDDPIIQNNSVERLSRDSVARGGPSKITMIGHSSGGLIARYYLSRATPDEFGTCYRGNVGQVICLGTPHQGVDIEDLLDPLPTNFLIYRLMVHAHFMLPPEYHEQVRLVRKEYQQLRKSTVDAFRGEESDEETPALKQFHPGSAFLNDINRPGAMPKDVKFFNIVGNVRTDVSVKVLGRQVLRGGRNFGDMLVSRESASVIPNAPSDCYTIQNTTALDANLGLVHPHVELEHHGEPPVPIHRFLR